MRVELRNVTWYGNEPEDDGGFTADIYIRGRMVGKARQARGETECYYKIEPDKRSKELFRQLCHHLEYRPTITPVGLELKDALLRYQMVDKEFTAPRYRVAWMKDCLAKYDASMMRYRVLRLKLPVEQIAALKHGKVLLLQVAVRLLLNDLKPGDYLVNNQLPEDVMRQVTVYQFNILSSIFAPLSLIQPTRQKGRRPR